MVTEYAAFISYSHKDEKTAAWLHKELEKYIIPSGVSPKQGVRELFWRRLGKFFRDREELPAGHPLTDKIYEALARAENLIVLCSPNAAQSTFVEMEIQEFVRLGKGEKVFPIILWGEDNQVFPPSLNFNREILDSDFRDGKDGKKYGLIKLIAGLLGVNPDVLAKREKRARNFRVGTIASAGIALLASVSMALVNGFKAEEAIEKTVLQNGWKALDDGDATLAIKYALAGGNKFVLHREDFRELLAIAIHKFPDLKVVNTKNSEISSVKFDPNGKKIITTYLDPKVGFEIYDISTKSTLSQVVNSPNAKYSKLYDVNLEGTKAVLGADPRIYEDVSDILLDLINANKPFELKFANRAPDAIPFYRFTLDGKFLFTSQAVQSSNNMGLYSTKEIGKLDLKNLSYNSVIGLDFDTLENFLASDELTYLTSRSNLTIGEGGIDIFNLRKAKPVKETFLSFNPNDKQLSLPRISSDAKFLAAVVEDRASGANKYVQIWDKNGELLGWKKPLTIWENPVSEFFINNNKNLLVSFSDHSAKLFDTNNPQFERDYFMGFDTEKAIPLSGSDKQIFYGRNGVAMAGFPIANEFSSIASCEQHDTNSPVPKIYALSQNGNNFACIKSTDLNNDLKRQSNQSVFVFDTLSKEQVFQAELPASMSPESLEFLEEASKIAVIGHNIVDGKVKDSLVLADISPNSKPIIYTFSANKFKDDGGYNGEYFISQDAKYYVKFETSILANQPNDKQNKVTATSCELLNGKSNCKSKIVSENGLLYQWLSEDGKSAIFISSFEEVFKFNPETLNIYQYPKEEAQKLMPVPETLQVFKQEGVSAVGIIGENGKSAAIRINLHDKTFLIANENLNKAEYIEFDNFDFSSSNNYLIAKRGRELQVWDLKLRQLIEKIKLDSEMWIIQLAFDEKNNKVLALQDNGKLLIYDISYAKDSWDHLEELACKNLLLPSGKFFSQEEFFADPNLSILITNPNRSICRR